MSISKTVTKKLIEKNISISTMESCTSGLIASSVTDTEGASAIFRGGFISYTNEVKILLGVSSNVIEKFGVYSPECAEEMAKTAKKFFGTDIAVSITGTTGNIDPNNPNGILGEAYFCIIYGDEIFNYRIKKVTSHKSRQKIKEMYVEEVFNCLEKIIG
ncbi:MAG: CinA family protein [Clostridia bacterium]|nr:CinA family protein [Clostridia bacterium]